MTRTAVTVPPTGDRQDGSKSVSVPTLMDSTPNLRKLVLNTFHGTTGKTLTYL